MGEKIVFEAKTEIEDWRHFSGHIKHLTFISIFVTVVVTVVAAAVVVVVVVVVTFKVTISKGVFQLPQYSARNKPDQSTNEK